MSSIKILQYKIDLLNKNNKIPKREIIINNRIKVKSKYINRKVFSDDEK